MNKGIILWWSASHSITDVSRKIVAYCQGHNLNPSSWSTRAMVLELPEDSADAKYEFAQLDSFIEQIKSEFKGEFSAILSVTMHNCFRRY